MRHPGASGAPCPPPAGATPSHGFSGAEGGQLGVNRAPRTAEQRSGAERQEQLEVRSGVEATPQLAAAGSAPQVCLERCFRLPAREAGGLIKTSKGAFFYLEILEY